MSALVNHGPERKTWEGTSQPAVPADAAIRGGPRAAERITGFDASVLSSCDEPVRRYFTHAIAHETPLEPCMRLRMTGRIKVGLWLPFTAQQDCDGSSFIWRAQVPRHVRLLTVTDSYDNGRAAIDGRLLGAIRMFHSADQNIVRSAAARAATEGILAPIGLLPSRLTFSGGATPDRRPSATCPSEETSSRRSDLGTSPCRPGFEWDGGMEPKNSARSLKPRSSAPCRMTAVDPPPSSTSPAHGRRSPAESGG